MYYLFSPLLDLQKVSEATENLDAILSHVMENELKYGWVEETGKREAEKGKNNTICHRTAVTLLAYLPFNSCTNYVCLATCCLMVKY